MTEQKSGDLLKDIFFGAIGGLLGTFVMDTVTAVMYNRESAQTRKKESMLMKKPAYTLLTRRLADKAGVRITDQQASRGGAFFHWAYGISWGAVYGVLHDRVPAFSKARGLLYGLAVFVLGDEALNTALKISPPPREFPLAVHVRGLIGHIVYAAAMDGTYRLLERAA